MRAKRIDLLLEGKKCIGASLAWLFSAASAASSAIFSIRALNRIAYLLIVGSIDAIANCWIDYANKGLIAFLVDRSGLRNESLIPLLVIGERLSERLVMLLLRLVSKPLACREHGL